MKAALVTKILDPNAAVPHSACTRPMGQSMYFQNDHPLGGERRRRRLAEAQRCIAIAIGAQLETLAVAMIDEAIQFVALERMPAPAAPTGDAAVTPGLAHP